jgi:hypothetical protein
MDDEGFPIRFDSLSKHDQAQVEAQIIWRFDLERSLQRKRVMA